MALITSYCGENATPENQMALIASDSVPPFRYLRYDTNLTAIKKNNNTYDHYGEMAMWQVRAPHNTDHPPKRWP